MEKQGTQPAERKLPIDRGYAWVILAGVAVACATHVGLVVGFGVLYVEFLDTYKQGSTLTALIYSAHILAFAASCPVAVVVSGRYTIRCSVMLGAVLAAAGWIGMALSPSLIATIGFFAVVGAGDGFIYGPAHVILVHYFDKRRSLANGIAASGASLGVFIVPPIMTYCISVYGIRGTCLILAGLHLNLTAAGSLLRPISFFDRQNENLVDKSGQSPDSNESLSLSKSNTCDGLTNEKVDTLKQQKDPSNEVTLRVNGRKLDNEQIFQIKNVDFIESRWISKSCSNLQYEPLVLNSQKCKSVHDISFDDREKANAFKCDQSQNWSVSLMSLNVLKQNHNQGYPPNTVSSETSKVSEKKPDLTFIKNPLFWMYTVGFFANIGGYSFVLFFFPKFAGEIGIDKFWISLLLSGGGIVQLFARFLMGYIADKNFMPPVRLVNICSLVSGTVTIVLVFVPHFPFVVIHMVVFSIFGGTFFSLAIVILADFVGSGQLSQANSFYLAVSSCLACVLPSFLGYLCEVSGTFSTGIWTSGVLFLIGTVVLGLEPLGRVFNNKRQLDIST